MIEKRNDGFHQIETVLYPIRLSDVFEAISCEGESQDVQFTTTGLEISGKPEHNLCVQAYQLLKQDHHLKPVHIHLHKVIPMGAGLGGGSSDGAACINMLDALFELDIANKQKLSYAAALGSDCIFFIDNRPAYAFERGEKLAYLKLDLSGYLLTLVCPDIHISTAEAYSGIIPQTPKKTLKKLIGLPVKAWRDCIINDFELSVFARHPEIAEIKQKLYDLGAVYASMSGSGSSVYGIFSEKAGLKKAFPECFVWEGEL